MFKENNWIAINTSCDMQNENIYKNWRIPQKWNNGSFE